VKHRKLVVRYLAPQDGPVPALGSSEAEATKGSGGKSGMLKRFKIQSWTRAHDGIPVRYYLADDEREAVFVFRNEDFEFSFETEALRHSLKIGTEALQDMDADTSGDPVWPCHVSWWSPSATTTWRRHELPSELDWSGDITPRRRRTSLDAVRGVAVAAVGGGLPAAVTERPTTARRRSVRPLARVRAYARPGIGQCVHRTRRPARLPHGDAS
jgi:hypothetical protein